MFSGDTQLSIQLVKESTRATSSFCDLGVSIIFKITYHVCLEIYIVFLTENLPCLNDKVTSKTVFLAIDIVILLKKQDNCTHTAQTPPGQRAHKFQNGFKIGHSNNYICKINSAHT